MQKSHGFQNILYHQKRLKSYIRTHFYEFLGFKTDRTQAFRALYEHVITERSFLFSEVKYTGFTAKNNYDIFVLNVNQKKKKLIVIIKTPLKNIILIKSLNVHC